MKITTNKIVWSSAILMGIVGIVVIILIIKKNKPYKKNIVKNANAEWERFGMDTSGKDGKKIREGAKEYDNGFWQRVGDYWKQALGENYTGKDRDVAWSSAFISWVMAKSGEPLGIPFKKSSAHATYIREYVKNRKEGRLKAPFVAYKIHEKPAEVGDLVCYSRENSSDLYDRTSNYKSHCDIVVKKRKGEIEVIGGNVGQSVSKKILSTDSLGRVNAGGKWFAIIKNNA